MSRLGRGPAPTLLLILSACSGPEETLRVILPEDGADAASRLVVTVLDPTAGAEAGTPFASCDALGPFPPIRLLAGGAAQPEAPAVLQRFESGLPVEEADFTLPALRATADNPWGVVAVVVEALAPVVDAGQIRSTPVFKEASILQSCYCVRTLAGRHPDSTLDARVKAACPFAGGAEGTSAAERELSLGAVMPDEFLLEPCGTDSAVVVANASDQRAAPACIRTRLCEDVAPGNLCFDCASPCGRAQDLSNAIVAYRVVTGALQPERQIVATNEDGEAWPVFSSQGCEAGQAAEIEASVPGRRTGAIRFSVRCVEGGRPRVVARTDAAFDPDDTGDLPMQPTLLFLPGQPGWSLIGLRSRLQAWQRVGSGFEPGPSLEHLQDTIVPDFLIGSERGDGVDVVAIHRRGFEPPESWVRLDRLRWTGDALQRTEPELRGQCQTCTCGSGSCASGQSCGPEERCVEGACRPAECPCSYQPLIRELMAAGGDFDGDGGLDVLLSEDGVAGSSSYYGEADGTRGSCRCDRNVFGASEFVLADLDADGRDDTVWQRGEGPALRLAQDRSAFCGSARPIGPPVAQPSLASGQLRCEPNSSCVGSELVVLSRLREGRVFFADPAVVDGDAQRFERAGTHARFLLPRTTEENAPRIRRRQSGDFNGDGFQDIALINVRGPVSIELLLGDGRGNLVQLPERLRPEDFDCQDDDLFLTSGDTDGNGRSETIVRCGNGLRVVSFR